MTERRAAELVNKIKFVKNLGTTLGQFDTICVSDLDYEVFLGEGNEVEAEYLVVTYKGGAIAARCCNGNSLSAIFDEVARLFNGGYYDEVDELISFRNNFKKM